jgi:hypothetical protein
MELPQWASWVFAPRYLPASFHSRAGFRRDLRLLQVAPTAKPWQAQHVLGLGLAIRDIMRQQVREEGMETDMPFWVQSSVLTMEDLDQILDCPYPVVIRYVLKLYSSRCLPHASA